MKDGYFLGTIILITYRRHSYSSGTHHILCFNHHRCLPWLVILLPACLSREPRLHRYPYCYPYPPVVSSPRSPCRLTRFHLHPYGSLNGKERPTGRTDHTKDTTVGLEYRGCFSCLPTLPLVFSFSFPIRISFGGRPLRGGIRMEEGKRRDSWETIHSLVAYSHSFRVCFYRSDSLSQQRPEVGIGRKHYPSVGTGMK